VVVCECAGRVVASGTSRRGAAPFYTGTADAPCTRSGEVEQRWQQVIGGEGRWATWLSDGATPWTHARVVCSERERVTSRYLAASKVLDRRKGRGGIDGKQREDQGSRLWSILRCWHASLVRGERGECTGEVRRVGRRGRGRHGVHVVPWG
jgi:hypothetical protein